MAKKGGKTSGDPTADDRIKDIDNGWKEIVDRVKELSKGWGVEVGIFPELGGSDVYEPVQHEDKEHGGFKDETDEGDEDLTVLEVAEIHEFGLREPEIPQRSWFNGFFDEQMEFVKGEILEMGYRLIESEDPEFEFENLGLAIADAMKHRIILGEIQPPNTSYTIEKKGSSTPLIDTGQMLATITHKVTKS